METTHSLIKADIGSIGGHIKPGQNLPDQIVGVSLFLHRKNYSSISIKSR